MLRQLLLLFVFALAMLSGKVQAQTICPPNIDFELGNLSRWAFFTGTCCAIGTTAVSSAMPGIHDLTSGSGVDPFGRFPVVAPGGGRYSLKLGNRGTGAQAEKARFYVPVPPGSSRYSIIYRYAVVLENPRHAPIIQPRFEVSAYDSATEEPLPCSQHSYVASSWLPDFFRVDSTDVYYKPWTTASIDLSHARGTTVAIDFASGDCGAGAHFGYGYVDMTCGIFAATSVVCDTDMAVLSAPGGFDAYSWRDSANMSVVIGLGQTISVMMDSVPKTYAVILVPPSGYFCFDTLYLRVIPSNLKFNLTADTLVCANDRITITSGATGMTMPLTYRWSPAAGLSCTSCPNPILTTSVAATYTITVSDPVGCVKTDSIKVGIKGHLSTSDSVKNVSCDGDTLGLAAISIDTGTPPYTFEWNTTPIKYGDLITGLDTGAYIVTVTDATGCVQIDTLSIIQPPVPEPPIAAPLTQCQHDEPIQLLAAGSNLRWYGPGLPDTGLATAPWSATAIAGDKIYWVTQHNGDCESSPSQALVTILPQPEPPLVRDTVYCRNYDADPLEAKGSNLIWYIASNLDSELHQTPVPYTRIAGSTTWYVAQVVDGCPSNKTAVTIKITPFECCKMIFPNAFTPNGDGLNDVFRPIFEQVDDIKVFHVFNRWGEAVYTSYADRPAWDGTYKGEPQDLGTFYYTILYDCNKKTIFEKGDFTLVR